MGDRISCARTMALYLPLCTVVIKLMSKVGRKRHSPILVSQEAYQLALPL